MGVLSSFDYAVIRVAPRVDREEFINAGVVLLCLERRYVGARVRVDQDRLRALWSDIDIECVERHLGAFPAICDGRPDAGPIAQLSPRERFHWLSSPRSSIIQVSPVHSGLCEDPARELERLFAALVL